MAIAPNPQANEAEKRERFLSLTHALRDSLWRGDALGRSSNTAISSGYAVLDDELPGKGWPTSVVTEVLWSQQGCGEIRMLAPALKSLSQAGKPIVLLGSPHDLIAPAFDQVGIDVKTILLVKADKPADRLWTAEQILRSGSVGALLSWHLIAKPEHLRRLQVAATACDGLAFIFRPANTRLEASPAPLRVLCEPAAFGHLAVDVFKRRGPAAAAPVLLPPLFAPSMTRALDRARRSSVVQIESQHVDRIVSSPVAARPGVPSLA